MTVVGRQAHAFICAPRMRALLNISGAPHTYGYLHTCTRAPRMCAPIPQITIAYPDEGAWKRFHFQFKSEGYPEVRVRWRVWRGRAG